MGSKFVKYLSLAMAIFYMAFGFFMTFTQFLVERIPNYRIAIGCIFLGYGTFRLTKIVMDIRRLNRQNKGLFDPED